ncbi:cold shock domain-containing protein [Sphingobacterium sp. N143]|uniref:cold-shock protein n=1 Tax=Sphingobacterium sp. N143 TaxID=2746727 RepID=UPI0025757237|nr:cold shock domain-containing protein [Sphingobacterium sp. N143]MDM1292941.1 cold shock domain-containing protein [Sphingobacterium sp. N143]
MSKSQITFNKKEREKKKLLKKQQKIEKKEFNKTNNDKGKSLEELFAYVDEYGNISDKPPVKLKEGETPASASTQDDYSFGKVVHYNTESNYGFIRDNETQQSVYFNDRLVGQKLNLNQKVKFKFKSAKQGTQVTEVLIEY